MFALPASDGGDAQLRDALGSFFNSYVHPIHPVKSAHIALTAGATDAIENVIHVVCDDGDSVLVPGPSWRKFSDKMTKDRFGKLTYGLQMGLRRCSRAEQTST